MLTAILNEYSLYLQAEKRMAPATVKSYQAAAEGFFSICGKHPQRLHLPDGWSFADLDKRAVEIYLNHLREERGWKPASVAQQASALRNLFGFLERRGHVVRNPARSLKPKVPPRNERPPEGAEEAVLQLFETEGGSLAGARLLLLLELFYGGALRGSQVYAIRSLRANHRAGVVKAVLAEETLEVPLTPAGLERAGNYLAARKAIVGQRRKAPFWINARGAACPPGRLSKEVRKAMEARGLEGGPSLLRQLAARHFKERGGDTRSVRQLLRAKRLGSLDRYAPPDYPSVLRQFRSLHPRQRGK